MIEPKELIHNAFYHYQGSEVKCDLSGKDISFKQNDGGGYIYPSLSEVDPIPVTGEYLEERLKFKLLYSSTDDGIFVWKRDGFEVTFVNHKYSLETQYLKIELKYIHNLQNLCFVLKGKELLSNQPVNKPTEIAIFITKNALSQGILVGHGVLSKGGKMAEIKTNVFGSVQSYYNNDFHLTFAGAIVNADLRKENKIKSLKRQIEKLESIDFSVEPKSLK